MSQTPAAIKRIYSDDKLLRYTGTDIPPDRRKHMIDGVLAEYDVKEVYWKWDAKAIDVNQAADISVMFKLEECIKDIPVKVPVRVDCPIIWDKPKPLGRPPRRNEQINWRVSLAAMYHFIYTGLNNSYAMQSSKVVAFLGYIPTADGKQLKDTLMPRLGEHAALEYTQGVARPK